MTVDVMNLKEAVEIIYDEHRQTQGERNAAELAALTKKWAWYMGESVTAGDKVYEMKPIPTRLWPTMAQLFENQLMANPRMNSLWEATLKTHVSLPEKWSLPLIRQIFPELIMMKICSIQPMPPSSGGVTKAFFWKVYRTDKSPEELVTTNDSSYALSGEREVPKRLRGELTSVSVTATKDMLNATWSQELEEDLMGAMGINIESEMLTAMAGEIMRELEQRVIQDILNGATAGNVNWDATVPSGYTRVDWYETLYHSLLDAEKLVRTNRHQRTNYLVCGLDFVTYLLKTQRFQAKEGNEPVEGPLSAGTRFEGSFGGRWQVYSTPYMTSAKAILSYYPIGMFHAGYIYMPYIPLMPMERTYADMRPFDDATLPGALENRDMWNRNVRTRWGKYLCAPDMFATVTIT